MRIALNRSGRALVHRTHLHFVALRRIIVIGTSVLLLLPIASLVHAAAPGSTVVSARC